MNHVPVQPLRHRTAFGRGLGHQPIDEPQLVHTLNHHVGLHALTLAPDEVVVERHIEVLDALHPRERLVRVIKIDVERVLRQLQPGIAHHLRAEGERMHDDVLRQTELAQVIPAEHAAGLHTRRKFTTVL